MSPDRQQANGRAATAPDENRSPAGGASSAGQLFQLQRAAMESSANAILITDSGGRILWTNPAFTTLTGYSLVDVAGRTPRVLKSGEHDRAFYRAMWQTLLAGRTWTGELVNRRKDGTFYVGEQTITPVRIDGQRITHFIGVFSEIAERQHTEDMLRATTHRQASRERMRIIRELSIVAAGTVLTFALGKLFGWFEALFRELADETQYPWMDETAGAVIFALVGLLVFSVRRWRAIREESILQQNVVATLGLMRTELEFRVAQRTSELARTNEALQREVAERKQAEERYRALVDAAPSGIFVNSDNRFTYVNQAMCRILGADSPVQLLGTGIFERIHPDCHAGIRDRIALGLAGKAAPLMDQRYLRLDGTVVDVETVATPIRQQGRRAIQVIVNDITRRKQAEAALQESQALYASLVEQMPAGIFRKDAAGRYTFMNAWFTEHIGISRENLLGCTASAVAEKILANESRHALQPSDSSIFTVGDRHHAEIMRTGAAIEVEESWHQPGGQRRYLQIVKSPVFDASGGIIGTQGVLFDVTTQKQLEFQLREQREQWSTLVATSPDAVFVLQDEKVAFANPAAAVLLKATPEALAGRHIYDFVPGEGQAASRARLQQASEVGGALPLREQKFIRVDGSVIEVEATSVRFQFLGRPALLVEARDISQRKRAESALLEAEHRFRQLTENIHEVFWLIDPATSEILYISPAYEKIWGYPIASLADSPLAWLEAVHPEDRAQVKASVVRQVEGPCDQEYRIRRPDGSERWIRDRAFPIRDAAGAVYRVAGLAEDITDRKRASLRLSLQHAVTQVLAETSPLERIPSRLLEALVRGLQWDYAEAWSVDRTTKVLRCTDTWHVPSPALGAFAAVRRASTFTSGTGLPGRVWKTGQAEWLDPIAGDPAAAQAPEAAKAGLSCWIGIPIALRGEVIGVVGLFGTRSHEADAAMMTTLTTVGSQLGLFTERQAVTEQFRRAQKMEALGTLAGGIAHDFNNIIAAISGYTELAKMEIGQPAAVSEHLTAVLAGSQRAAALVRQILAFSRQQEHERRPTQLRHIVNEALNLLRATIPATIEFHTSFERDLPLALADATHVHQVVMNLCTNAWHAMRDRPGRLGVELARWEVGADFAETHPALRPGPHLRLTVSDTGHGMDQATLTHIFEPFFTTKAPGEGTGLGLAVVHGIMQSHEGEVTVYSQPGEGTVFHLYFPACRDEAAASAKAAPAPIPAGHGERVLYVDDEAPLAKMTGSVLTRLGYTAKTCTNPVEALEQFRANPSQFDLVITDLAMPAMSGPDFAQRLRAIRADLPIVLVTGYSQTFTPARVQSLGLRELLLKPFSVDTLAATVARVLAGTKSA